MDAPARGPSSSRDHHRRRDRRRSLARSTGHTYDAASNRKTLTAPDGSTNTYNYDTLNRLSTLTNSLTGQFGFGYDALNRRTQLTRPNGINTNYGYDSVSRLLSVLHQAGSTTLDGASYTYDLAGNRTSKTNQRTAVTEGYGYDLIYQLTQVTQGASTTESYSYDAVGNRLSSLGVNPYSYNSSNQLTATPSGSYTYDANGNTLNDASGKQYTWDFENRLTQVVNPGVGTTIFRYDPFGRRIQKSGPLGTTNYVYDRGNVVEEVDNAGNVLARYTQSLMVDQPLSEFRSGTGSYYHADGLGSVTSLSDGTGVQAKTYSFDSFGKLSASSGTLTNPFQYTGRESDQETGLYYYRARYYDTAIGRFLGEDPLRLRQGPNYYAYVNNDPINLIDPTGLAPCCDPFRESANIEREIENARNRLRHLQQFGTALLPTDTVANVGAMTGCLSGGHVVGTNIAVPSQYIMAFRHNPNTQPCQYKCDFMHESVHARQCTTFGSRFYTLSEAETEIPAYMMELGCYLRMQYENGLGPYGK